MARSAFLVSGNAPLYECVITCLPPLLRVLYCTVNIGFKNLPYSTVPFTPYGFKRAACLGLAQAVQLAVDERCTWKAEGGVR